MFRIDQRINSKLEQMGSLEHWLRRLLRLYRMCRLADLKREIMGVIRAIENLEYQTLLELRYLCFYPWEKVAVEMDYDLRYMHKLHRKALEQCSAFVPAGE